MKFLKIVLITFILIFIAICIELQVECEKYFTSQNQITEVQNKQKRISYKPFAAYFIENLLSKKNLIDRKCTGIIYSDPSIKSYLSSGWKDEYMVHCYFTDIEKNKFRRKKII